jgi:polyisoprenyl-phosphate glycosyltransferase
MHDDVEISLVVPMHNEEAMVERFFARVAPILASITPDYEVICVDDGSHDQTVPLLLKARSADPRIRIVSLSRRFGKEAALTAGIEHASGRAVIPIDADLQDPPELLTEMVAKWREGYDTVVAVRADRSQDSALKRATAAAFYGVMKRVGDVPITPNAGDFRLLDRRVVEALKQLPERTRFMKGLFAWLGFRTAYVSYARPERAAGTTKWQYPKLWRFALEGITSFTSLPLTIWTYAGALMALFAFLYALFIIGRTLLLGTDLPGYASLVVIILFFSGLNMLGIGIIGEYLGRVFVEVKHRPLYLVGNRYGFDDPAAESGPAQPQDSSSAPVGTGGQPPA